MCRAAWPAWPPLLIGVQIVRGLLPDELDLTLLLALAFIPARYSGAALELPGGYLTAVTSFVTYMVVHAGWVHLLVNLLWMLAFGSAVARRIGDRKFLVFSVLCGIAGALTHLAFHYGEWRRWSGPRRRSRARWPARSDLSSARSGTRASGRRISSARRCMSLGRP